MKRFPLLLALMLSALTAFAQADGALPSYKPEHDVIASLDADGDEAMRPLMEAWLAALAIRQPGLRRGEHWRFVHGGSPFGALMFETADVAPLARLPTPAELAPYAHQFAGDMMKSPLMVRVAGTAENPAFLLVNKRPDAPLPPVVA